MTEQEEFEFRLRLERERPEKPREDPISIKNILGAAIEPNLSLASSALVTPVAGLAGLATAAGNKLKLTDMNPGDVVRNIQNKATYQPQTTGGQNAMAAISYPFEKIAEGADYAGGAVTDLTGSPLMGAQTNTVINMLPSVVGGAAFPKGGPTLHNVSGAASRKMMTSALKPDLKSGMKGQGERAVQTLLDEGINATSGGAAKLQERVGSVNDRITDAIANSTKTVDQGAVLGSMRDVENSVRNQVAPKADIAAVQRVADEFLNHPDLVNQIPVQQAQKMKQGTYKQIKDRYGEQGAAEVEAQKALARGLKEQIAKEVPEISALNMREGDLLNALNLVEKRALVDANKNPVGLGPLASRPAGAAMFLADRSALVKSLIARALNPGKQLPVGDSALAYAAIPEFNADTKERQKIIDALMGRN